METTENTLVSIKKSQLDLSRYKENSMKKAARTDSQVDAIAAVLLLLLVVSFAVVWVAGQ
ncbi:MAG TPA: hypothetical protein VL091_11925 [Marinobacter sp.]|nr:hypothetical protein [Marinobacter sp.]